MSGLLTCDPLLTRDVVNLFHYLTGHAHAHDLRVAAGCAVDHAAAAAGIDRARDRESKFREAGEDRGENESAEDPEIIHALCDASVAGVPIDLIIRGFCCLRPGVAGRTENIQVRSIIRRFLEHSRIFYSANGNENPVQGEYFIGSADWMYRNLSNRIEVGDARCLAALRQRLSEREAKSGRFWMSACATEGRPGRS